MSKKNIAKSTLASTSPALTGEFTSDGELKTEVQPTIPVIKETPVEERQYRLVTTEGEPMKFRGKQRQIVYNVLLELGEASTIAQVAEVADKLELKAVGGTEPSVRYHLHHMTKDGITEVVNPTITIE
jgi:hypothetical protein